MNFINEKLHTYFLRNPAETLPAQFYAVLVRTPSDWESITYLIARQGYSYEIALEITGGGDDFPRYLKHYVAAAAVEKTFFGDFLELPDLSEAQARRWLADYQAWEERRVAAIFQNGQTVVQGTLF